MKKLSVILVCLMILLVVSACAPALHAFSYPDQSNELISKFGPPTRVNQSVGGVEVWEYDAQDLTTTVTWYYYVKDGKIIKRDSKYHRR